MNHVLPRSYRPCDRLNTSSPNPKRSLSTELNQRSSSHPKTWGQWKLATFPSSYLKIHWLGSLVSDANLQALSFEANLQTHLRRAQTLQHSQTPLTPVAKSRVRQNMLRLAGMEHWSWFKVSWMLGLLGHGILTLLPLAWLAMSLHLLSVWPVCCLLPANSWCVSWS
jgi:hypothetical protein